MRTHLTATMRPGASTMRRVPVADDVCDLGKLFARHWTLHEDNLWLAVIAAPLALTAFALLGQWWTWPVVMAAVFAASPSWRWFWLLALELAVIGAEWAYLGATGLADNPGNTLLIGSAWIAFPLALAAGGALNRKRHGHPVLSR
jgi:hypothetical protein